MTSDERAELRRLAEAATPGPWAVDDGDLRLPGVRTHDAGPDNSVVYTTCHDYPTWRSDVAYIAAAHPGAVLALLDDLAAAEAERDRLKDEVERLTEVLRRVEWQGVPFACCADGCTGSPANGHAADCALDAALKGGSGG